MAPDDEDVNDYKLSDFDEKLEIEKLQETIKNMSNFTDDADGFISQSPQMLMQSASDKFAPAEGDEEFDPYAAIEQPVAQTNRKPKAKKFVVMVEPENIPYFDGIPMDERTKVFNQMLTEYRTGVVSEGRKKHLIKFTKHTFVAVMTILISLPVMFFIVNKSIELTVKNYKDVQYNFEKLYESKGRPNIPPIKRTLY